MKRFLIITSLALVSANAWASEPESNPYQVTVNASWYERAAWREYQAARHAKKTEAAAPTATPAPALQYDAINNSHVPITTAKSLFDQKLAARQQQVAAK